MLGFNWVFIDILMHLDELSIRRTAIYFFNADIK